MMTYNYAPPSPRKPPWHKRTGLVSAGAGVIGLMLGVGVGGGAEAEPPAPPETVMTTVHATETTTATETATETATAIETVTAEPASTPIVTVTATVTAPAVAPIAAPVSTQAAVVEPEPASQPTYFKNCTAARKAGAAPVRVGDPGYGTHLDRDGDGVGCE